MLRAKKVLRKICLVPAVLNDDMLLKILPQVVVGFFVTRFIRGSSYTAASSKGIQYYTVLNFLLQPNEGKKMKLPPEIGRLFLKFWFSLSMSLFTPM